MRYCPQCGKSVDDEARFCPYCSQSFEKMFENQPKSCLKCGKQIESNFAVCPYCGTPVNGQQVYNPVFYAQPVAQEKSKSHKGIWAIVIVLLLAIVVLIGWLTYEKIQEDKQKEEKLNELLEYHDTLVEYYNTLVPSAKKADRSSILILKVWKNCIEKEEDSETDKYTKDNNGHFYEDFNDALEALYADESFIEGKEQILDGQKKVDKLYKKLMNPPEQYEDAFDIAKKLYSAYNDLCKCGTDPTGNINTATSKHNDADYDSAKYANELYLFLEDPDE